jgi:hypothetical protein
MRSSKHLVRTLPGTREVHVWMVDLVGGHCRSVGLGHRTRSMYSVLPIVQAAHKIS